MNCHIVVNLLPVRGLQPFGKDAERRLQAAHLWDWDEMLGPSYLEDHGT